MVRTLKRLGTVCLCVALAAMLGYAVAGLLRAGDAAARLTATQLLKAVPVFSGAAFFLSAAVYLSASAKVPRASVLGAAVTGAAFVLYGFGDLLLALPHVSGTFIPGGLGFFFGHLVFAFSSMASAWGIRGGSLSVASRWRMWTAVGACAATQVCAVVLSTLVSDTAVCPLGGRAQGFTVWLYISAFTVTVVFGALWWDSAPSVAFAVVAAHIFISSDTLLFVSRNCVPDMPNSDIWVMATYWIACIVLTVAPIRAMLRVLS